MGSTPIRGTVTSMWRNRQTRCLQMADVGGSNPLMGTISGCGAIDSALDLESDGLNIVYHYEPSREFGQGCLCNENPLREITAETLLEAERFGKNFGHRGCINVPNIYDGGTHRESVWRAPKHHENAYKAMMQSWCAKQLIEL